MSFFSTLAEPVLPLAGIYNEKRGDRRLRTNGSKKGMWSPFESAHEIR